MKKQNLDAESGAQRRDVLLGAIATTFTICSPALAIGAHSPERSAIVPTSNGPVQGFVASGIHTFKGVRYGASTGGMNRFKPPQKPRPWTMVADALEFGNSAMQGSIGGTPQDPDTSLGPLEPFVRAGTDSQERSEDCLFLNVYTPGTGDGGRRPIMVWLHGGGFAMGSGSVSAYDGTALAKQGDVVVVTINHRLDVFGYAQVDHLLGDEYRSSGEVGILDIVAALEWVRDNASAFGGDPGNVTIFGESGGGMKACVLLAMPKAKGLFHRAIIQSGPAIRVAPLADGHLLANMLLEELKLAPGDARKLLELSEIEVVKAAKKVSARAPQRELGRMGFVPVVDGIVLPHQPFDPLAPEPSALVPIMIGTTAHEMSLFLLPDPRFGSLTWQEVQERLKLMLGARADAALDLHRQLQPEASPTDILVDVLTQISMRAPSIEIAERKIAQNAAPVWVYQLDFHSPALDGALRATHGLDIGLVFNNIDQANPMVKPGPDADAVAKQMSSAWIAFARTGNPNDKVIPDWPSYSMERREVMLFNVKSRLAPDHDHDARSFWSRKTAK